MTRFPIAIAATAALLCGTAAVAQMKPAPKPTAKATVAVKGAPAAKATVAAKAAPATKPIPAKPAPVAKPVPVKAAPAAMVAPVKPAPVAVTKPAPAAPKPKAAPAANGRMVSAKLANGKTVTYNCSLAGNKTKKACQ